MPATRLTPAQIAVVASRSGGWAGRDLEIAVAVALAESSGNPNAINHNTNGSEDYGLWQINSIHEQTLKQGNPYNPDDNARMARAVFDGSHGWTPWVTYTSGAYLIHLPVARTGVQNMGSAPDVTTKGGKGVATVGFNPVVPIASTGTFSVQNAASLGVLGPLFAPLAGFWWRWQEVVLGFIIMLIGAYLLFKDTKVGAQAISTAKKAALKAAEVAVVA